MYAAPSWSPILKCDIAAVECTASVHQAIARLRVSILRAAVALPQKAAVGGKGLTAGWGLDVVV